MAKESEHEIPEQMRKMADQSVEQARQAFVNYMTATQKAVTQMESSANASHAASKDIQQDSLNFAEEQVNKTFDFAQKLVRAKDPQEMMSLQMHFLQEQMSFVSDRTRKISEKFAKSAQDVAKQTK
jgi:phasin